MSEESKFIKLNANMKRAEAEKKTTFPALEKRTTWQQQLATSSNSTQADSGYEIPSESDSNLPKSQQFLIKLELQEKKRKIQLKKKRMEMIQKKQWQEIGKVVFLQAVSKGSGGEFANLDRGTLGKTGFEKRMLLQNKAMDLDSFDKKCLHHNDSNGNLTAPDSTTDERSFELGVHVENEVDVMNSTAHVDADLLADISKISLQQDQVANLKKYYMDDSSSFTLPSPPIINGIEPSPSRLQMCQVYGSLLLTDGKDCFPPTKPTKCWQLPLESTPYSSVSPLFSHVPQMYNNDFYSEVVNPEHRHAPSSPTASPPSQQQGLVNSISISYVDHHNTAETKTSAEVHGVLSKVPDHEPSDYRKEPSDETSGIPVEKKSKNPKGKLQRNPKVASVDVPMNGTEDLNSNGYVIGADFVHTDPIKTEKIQEEYASTKEERNNLQVSDGCEPSRDGASDMCSSVAYGDYSGPKLFVKPAAKSNRGIVINAINTVLAGPVNADTKNKVLEEINRSENQHFLILFRDIGYQFRALYTYNPEREEATKLFGIGPKIVEDKMMERFYKYNSGGKCFSEIPTKHLTATIDAFTIPNSVWAGKRVIPPKKVLLT